MASLALGGSKSFFVSTVEINSEKKHYINLQLNVDMNTIGRCFQLFMEKDGAVSKKVNVRTCWRTLEAKWLWEPINIGGLEKEHRVKSELSNTCSWL